MFFDEYGGVGVVKMLCGGYDGKGVCVVWVVGEVEDWMDVFDDGDVFFVEEFVLFVCEFV